MRHLRTLASVWLVLSLLSCSSSGTSAPDPKEGEIRLRVQQDTAARARSEARGKRAIISTQGAASTEAARKVLASGGSIIDAAVAASFAIAVERPHSTGLGGGGFLLYHEAKSGKTHAIDFRERAPLKATRDMYLNEKGEVIPDASVVGIRAVAVPGFLQGMAEIHRKFGKQPLSKLLEPAIELAAKGLVVYPALARALDNKKDELARFEASRAIFLRADGTPYLEGQLLVQQDLALTLQRLAAARGPDALNREIQSIQRQMVATSQALGGLLSMEDFKRYRVKWRSPVRGTFRGHEIVSMPPPSSGGAHVIEILNILEGFPMASLGPQSAESIHRLAAAEQLAFADRAVYMGDPDFFEVPLEELVSKKYAERQRARINPEFHTPSDEVQAGKIGSEESTSTTHFSIMDEAGNVVSSTQTINDYFGSSVVAAGTGIALNNEMDDFSAKPGVANIFGAVGGDANAIQPMKTPLSSMSPTIVFKDGKPVMAVGAPGGTRIISCVMETLLNRIEYKMPLYEAVGAIRYHHQWKPDELAIDLPGPGPKALDRLKAMGYAIKLKERAVPCSTMAVARDGDGFVGVSDQGDAGSSAGL